MARKIRESLDEEHSPSAAILEEEKRLRIMLEDAKTEAGRMVGEAERASEERLREIRESLPRLVEARWKEKAAGLEEEAGAAESALAGLAADLELEAGSKLPYAVKKIVAAVWPGEIR